MDKKFDKKILDRLIAISKKPQKKIVYNDDDMAMISSKGKRPADASK